MSITSDMKNALNLDRSKIKDPQDRMTLDDSMLIHKEDRDKRNGFVFKKWLSFQGFEY